MTQTEPDPLASTWVMIDQAFPDGIQAEDMDFLIALLYEHMSDRQLGLVVARLTRSDVATATNRIYRVATAAVSRAGLERVHRALRDAGFDAWVQE